MIVSFQSFGSKVVAARIAADKAEGKSRDIIATAFQQFLDSCALAGIPRDLENVDAIGKEIRESQVFLDAVAAGYLLRETVTNYATAAKRAYFWNMDWKASGYANPDKGGLPFLPEGKGAKAEAKAKVGKVQSTTDKALLETLKKAIEQALILNRLEAKGLLIDVACTIDPEFKV